MSKIYSNKLIGSFLFFLLMCQLSFAQTNITGNIVDATTKSPMIGVSVQVKGKVIGTITDAKGNFALSTNTPKPFVLQVSYVGYETQEINVADNKTNFNISLNEQAIQGQEVVVAASRFEQSVLQSPVTIEKMDIRGIKETPSSNFYDGLANIKGVDMATQGMLFKSINMRGFGSTGNPRTVQLIDGMDNSAPGLNFPVDNIIGMPELDVESVELLPGAASALYGPNALNGLILMTSKSPFLYQGLSANVKAGVMTASNRATATTPFTDYSIRYAKAFNNKFAFKANFSYLQAKDWQGTNYTNMNVGGNADPSRAAGTNSNYDGLNVFGDEIATTIGTKSVSRTGLMEKDIVDYSTKSLKFNGALHYRITEKTELIAQLNYGLGTTVYTGAGRYSLRDFSITQAKLELKGDNYMLRGYTTQENSGKSYQAGLTAIGMINDVSSNSKWFTTYGTALATNGGDEVAARKAADAGFPAVGTAAFTTLLDKYRNTPITQGGGGFDDKTNLYHAEGLYNFKNQIKFIELLVGGNYRTYNLKSNGTLFADMKDGRNGRIAINEYGAYAQAGKTLFNNHLKLTASLRYDKNQNFEGQFSPRFSAVSTFGDHNFRASYQTGFRIPTTQNQYIDLKTPLGTLIGGLDEFNSRYNLTSGVTRETLLAFAANPANYITATNVTQGTQYYTAAVGQITAGVTAAVQTQVTSAVTAAVNAAVAAGTLAAANAAAAIQAGVSAQMASSAIQTTIQTNVANQIKSNFGSTNSQANVGKLAAAYALTSLPKYVPKTLVPEKIQAIELGYKGLIAKKLFIDASYYHSTYKNFIGSVSILVPLTPSAPGLPIESGLGGTFGTNYAGYSRPANSSQTITASGVSLGLTYMLEKGYSLGGSISQNKLGNFTPTAEVSYAGFNTPEYVYKASFGKRITSSTNWGFNVAFRHQDSFLWESSFVMPSNVAVTPFSNTMVPAINNIDAQISRKLTGLGALLKIGGTNLFGKPYYQATGSAYVGSTYYASITVENLFSK